MRTFKKCLTLLMTIIMIGALAACNNNEEETAIDSSKIDTIKELRKFQEATDAGSTGAKKASPAILKQHGLEPGNYTLEHREINSVRNIIAHFSYGTIEGYCITNPEVIPLEETLATYFDHRGITQTIRASRTTRMFSDWDMYDFKILSYPEDHNTPFEITIVTDDRISWDEPKKIIVIVGTNQEVYELLLGIEPFKGSFLYVDDYEPLDWLYESDQYYGLTKFPDVLPSLIKSGFNVKRFGSIEETNLFTPKYDRISVTSKVLDKDPWQSEGIMLEDYQRWVHLASEHTTDGDPLYPDGTPMALMPIVCEDADGNETIFIADGPANELALMKVFHEHYPYEPYEGHPYDYR